MTADARFLQVFPKGIPFRWGRADLTAEWSQLTRLPDFHDTLNDLRVHMGPGRLDLSDQQIVALTGAHTLGFSHPEVSGFSGAFDITPKVFDNEFFKALVGGGWTQHIVPHTNNLQWTKSVNGVTVHAIPSDVIIAFDPRQPTDATRFPSTRQFVQLYADDEATFFTDFVGALVKIQENVVPILQNGRAPIPQPLFPVLPKAGADVGVGGAVGAAANQVFVALDVKALLKPVIDAHGLQGYYNANPKPFTPPKPRVPPPTPPPVAVPVPVPVSVPVPVPVSVPVPVPVSVPVPVPRSVPAPVPVSVPVPVPRPVPVPVPLPVGSGSQAPLPITGFAPDFVPQGGVTDPPVVDVPVGQPVFAGCTFNVNGNQIVGHTQAECDALRASLAGNANAPTAAPTNVIDPGQAFRQSSNAPKSGSSTEARPWVWAIVAVGGIALIAVVVLSILLIRSSRSSHMETV